MTAEFRREHSVLRLSWTFRQIAKGLRVANVTRFDPREMGGQ
jgi:hypothetical protein